MKSPVGRIFLLGFAVAALACSRGDPSESKAASSKPGTASGPATEAGTDAWTDQWRKETFGDKDPTTFRAEFSKAAQSELSKPGADPSDVTAKAHALDRDPQRIFDFIRDSIALEPYAGVLRGARGTLMAGAGNALDRALLAQDLLKASDVETRLVAGKLSAAQATSLLSRYLDGSALPTTLAALLRMPDDAALGAEAANLSSRTGLPEPKVRELLQHVRAQNQDFWTRTDAKRSTQFDFLINHLAKSNLPRKVERSTLAADLKDRLREHYWVELKASDGSWTPFDPSFADAQRGVTYGSAPVRLSEVPKEKYHQLAFSLVYRTAVGGAAKDEVLIADSFPSANALFAPLEFGIGPADGGANVNDLASMQAKQLIDMLQKIKRFRPVLRAGSSVTSGRLFDLDGHTYDPTDTSPAKSGGGFFGDALGGGEEESPPQFLELKVVLRLTGPGRASESQSRTLVRAEDLMDRNFAPPILNWQMLLQGQWLSAQFVGFNALRQMAQVSEALGVASSAERADKALAQLPSSVPLGLMELALLRESAAARNLAETQGIRAFVDAPMLTIMAQRLTGLRVAEGQITREMSIDIVENSVRYVPRDDTSQQSAFAAALRQGVADCVLESQYLVQLAPGADNRSGTAILEQAVARPQSVILAGAQDSSKISNTGLPQADVAWIQENESPESVLLIATVADGSGAWWSIGPDGNAILRARGGEGQAGTETAETTHGAGGMTLQETIKFSLMILCIFEIEAAELELLNEGHVSAHHVVNVVVCLAASALAIRFLAYEAHEASWLLIGAEATWYGGQLSWAAGEHFAIHGFSIH
jgi:hypothetical protein